MSRKNTGPMIRKIAADRRHGNVVLAKFINNVMLDGKRAIAEGIVYSALDGMVGRIEGDHEPLEAFLQAIENVKPIVEVKSRRVGGANYQIPLEVRPERRQALAFRWILEAARGRNEHTMVERLSRELADAYNKTGISIKKREDVHRMAEANKAFAHYRW